MSLTQYAYYFGDFSDWEAANTIKQEGIHFFSIDTVSGEIVLLRTDFRAIDTVRGVQL